MLRIPGHMQLTLVSHYGEKDPDLADLIHLLQMRLGSLLPGVFRPYQLEQVHGTIVGLEGCGTRAAVRNENSGQSMDVKGLLAYLSQELHPIDVRIGGYRHISNFPFNSRGLHPYLRSFSIQGEIAVAMGWSMESDAVNRPLDGLRREFIRFGVRHKWHKSDDDVDDDFFFVLGRIDRRRVTAATRDAVAEEMRMLLAGHSGTTIRISNDTLRLVGYLDSQLPLETSCWYSIEEPEIRETVATIYPQCAGEEGCG